MFSTRKPVFLTAGQIGQPLANRGPTNTPAAIIASNNNHAGRNTCRRTRATAERPGVSSISSPTASCGRNSVSDSSLEARFLAISLSPSVNKPTDKNEMSGKPGAFQSPGPNTGLHQSCRRFSSSSRSKFLWCRRLACMGSRDGCTTNVRDLERLRFNRYTGTRSY